LLKVGVCADGVKVLIQLARTSTLISCNSLITSSLGLNLVQALLIINGAPSLQRGPWSRVCHGSFPDTCILNWTWLSTWRYPQRGMLQTSCPHPTSWNMI